MNKENLTRENTISRTIRNITDFSVRLLQQTMSETENTLISPISLLAVLSMIQQGASGKTLVQIENTLGAKADVVANFMNTAFSSDWQGLDFEDQIHYKLTGEVGRTAQYANAVWINDNGKIIFNKEYFKMCAETPCAEVFQETFDDTIVMKINNWASEKTNSEIKRVVDRINQEDVMFLANALSFDAAWDKCYEAKDIETLMFMKENGDQQEAQFMKGEVNCYLIDNVARGFRKAYKDCRYEFVALLPDKGVSLHDYIAALNGKQSLSVIDNPIMRKVKTMLPKFATSQSVNLTSTLKSLGITDAFEKVLADFSDIGTPVEGNYNLCLGSVWQENKIQVSEYGSRALSITMTGMKCLYSCAELQPLVVNLDRPFMYMIIDVYTNLPLFMGTIMDVHK